MSEDRDKVTLVPGEVDELLDMVGGEAAAEILRRSLEFAEMHRPLCLIRVEVHQLPGGGLDVAWIHEAGCQRADRWDALNHERTRR